MLLLQYPDDKTGALSRSSHVVVAAAYAYYSASQRLTLLLKRQKRKE